MITSLTEMLQLPNFGHVTSSTISFELRDRILLLMSKSVITTSQPLFLNRFILRRPGVANFADIMKILTMFVKKIFKD